MDLIPPIPDSLRNAHRMWCAYEYSSQRAKVIMEQIAAGGEMFQTEDFVTISRKCEGMVEVAISFRHVFELATQVLAPKILRDLVEGVKNQRVGGCLFRQVTYDLLLDEVCSISNPRIAGDGYKAVLTFDVAGGGIATVELVAIVGMGALYGQNLNNVSGGFVVVKTPSNVFNLPDE